MVLCVMVCVFACVLCNAFVCLAGVCLLFMCLRAVCELLRDVTCSVAVVWALFVFCAFLGVHVWFVCC